MSCARTGVFGARAFVGRARAGATTAGTSRSTRAGSASGDEGGDASRAVRARIQNWTEAAVPPATSSR